MRASAGQGSGASARTAPRAALSDRNLHPHRAPPQGRSRNACDERPERATLSARRRRPGDRTLDTGMTMADTLTITDNRTGKSYELPIQYGTYPHYGAWVSGLELRRIKASDEDFGLLSYDPAFMNTASSRSAITFIDGDKRILRYRGYSIDELAMKRDYLGVAYVLLTGELPTKSELDDWVHRITHHTLFHENIKKFIDGFHH